MTDNNLFATLLSPPTSPCMADYGANIDTFSWEDEQMKPFDLPSNSTTGAMPLLHIQVSGLNQDAGHERLPSSKKPFKPICYELTTPGGSVHSAENPPPSNANSSILGGNYEVASADLSQTSPIESALGSPQEDVRKGSDSQPQDFDSIEIASEDISDDFDERPEMNSADYRNQKRKMKRFRLTHNQTRFLMSEFARQAHPDAAHRERLSREIPGLSPRQVQVWFQNRRAKLKRLTSDDRERMMQSRALPDDFDMKQALHSPFGAAPPASNALNTPTHYTPAFPGGSMVKPLNLDGIRRASETSKISPTGITPSFGRFNITPPPSATDALSPLSATGNGSFKFPSGLDNNQRGNGSYASDFSATSAFPSRPPNPRLQLHSHCRSSSMGVLPSSSRSNAGYSDPDRRGAGLSTANLADESSIASNRKLAYSVEMSYNDMSTFAPTHTTRIRSQSHVVPPRQIDLDNCGFQFDHVSSSPQTAMFPGYASSPLLATSFSMMSAPHDVTSFPRFYHSVEPNSAEPFPSLTSMMGARDPGSREGDGEEGPQSHLPPY